MCAGLFFPQLSGRIFEKDVSFLGEKSMSSEKPHLRRQDLLAALEQGWKHYLSEVNVLSEEEEARYAQEQGFSRLQDVLAHIFGWWDLSMRRSFQVLSGHAVPIEDDMDALNAEMVAHAQQWTREAVEATFTTTLIAFEHFLMNLPEAAFENEHIQLWLRIDAIDHYEDHRLPHAPPVQERGLERWKEAATRMLVKRQTAAWISPILSRQHNLPMVQIGRRGQYASRKLQLFSQSVPGQEFLMISQMMPLRQEVEAL